MTLLVLCLQTIGLFRCVRKFTTSYC